MGLVRFANRMVFGQQRACVDPSARRRQVRIVEKTRTAVLTLCVLDAQLVLAVQRFAYPVSNDVRTD